MKLHLLVLGTQYYHEIKDRIKDKGKSQLGFLETMPRIKAI